MNTKNPTETSVSIMGWGACTALGHNWSSTERNLLNGEVGPQPESIQGISSCFSRIDNFQPDESSRPRYHGLARESLRDLGVKSVDEINEPLGMIAASSKGDIGHVSTESVTGIANPGIWAGSIASEFESIRQVASPNTACATGLSALIHGCRWIQDGEISHAVVTASESCFRPFMLAAYENLGVFCSEDGMRPFHPERDGFALGEAAASLWIMDSSLADETDATSKGKIIGWGETCDAHHMTQMDQEGKSLNQALEISLESAGVTHNEVDILHAHLTTTPNNDELERRIIENFPGEPVLQGIKPALGHTIGAAGLLELIATVQTLNTGQSFPIVNTDKEHVPGEIRDLDRRDSSYPRHGLSWNMGFGGHNAAVAVEVNDS